MQPQGILLRLMQNWVSIVFDSHHDRTRRVPQPIIATG